MKPETPPALDTGFRNALARLRAAGRIRTLDREADPDYEIASIMKRLDGAEALLFPKVKGHRLPVLGNLLCSQANCEAAFGVGYREIRQFVARALGNPIPPQRVAAASCQEHVHRDGFDIGRMLPVLRHTQSDSGRFITAGIVVVQDPETGVYNASYHCVANRHGHDSLCPLYHLALFDLIEVAEEHCADLVFFKVQSNTGNALGKVEQFTRHHLL